MPGNNGVSTNRESQGVWLCGESQEIGICLESQGILIKVSEFYKCVRFRVSGAALNTVLVRIIMIIVL